MSELIKNDFFSCFSLHPLQYCTMCFFQYRVIYNSVNVHFFLDAFKKFYDVSFSSSLKVEEEQVKCSLITACGMISTLLFRL